MGRCQSSWLVCIVFVFETGRGKDEYICLLVGIALSESRCTLQCIYVFGSLTLQLQVCIEISSISMSALCSLAS